MRIIKIIFLTLIFYSVIIAQDKNKDGAKWSGNLSLRGLFLSGNTNKLYGASSAEIKRQDSVYTLDLLLSLDYGETKNIKDQNSFFGDFSADMYHYKTLSPLILQIGEFNFATGIKFRSQTGGGLKLNFIKHPEHKTSISLAVIYDYTKLIEKPGNYNSKTWRFSWRFKTTQILVDKRLILSNTTFYQPSVKSINDAIWRSETIMEAPIVKFLSIHAAYLYTHNDIVSVGRKRSDPQVSFGLSIKAGDSK